jgi:hypothetical protein
MKKCFLLIVIPFALLTACKKDNNSGSLQTTTVDTTLLVSQESTYTSSNVLYQTRTFTYNAQNRMTLQYNKIPGSYSSSTAYGYDSNGNLITAALIDTVYTNSVATSISTANWTYTYTNNIPVSATQVVQSNGGSTVTADYTFTVTNNQITALSQNNVVVAAYAYAGNNLTSETDYFGSNSTTYTSTYNVGKSAFYLSGCKWNFPDAIIPVSGQNQLTTYGIPNGYTNIYTVTSFNTFYPLVISESSSLTNTQSQIDYKYIQAK